MIKKTKYVLKDKEFTEHPDPMQLALFKEHKLSEADEKAIFKHLAQCKRCRDVLKVANELELEERNTGPANNPNYKGILKPFIPFAAVFLIFLAVPQGNKYISNDVTFKGVVSDKNIFEESVEYWEDLFKKLFKDN